MVRDVLMQIRQNQEQLEHSVSLFRTETVCSLLEALNNRKSVGKQPFETLRIDWVPLTAAPQRLIGAKECLLDEVIEAESLCSQRGRNRSCTRRPSAISRNTVAHDTPRIAKRRLATNCVRDYHISCPRGMEAEGMFIVFNSLI